MSEKNSKTARKEKAGAKHGNSVKAKQATPTFNDPTKPGDRKILQNIGDPAFKSYSPAVTSSSWYDYWCNSGIFDVDHGQSHDKNMSITGFPSKISTINHLGNAFNLFVQDTLARYYSMKGKNVLKIEGFNYGDIHLEDSLEKKLLNDKKTKYQLSEEDFAKKIEDLKTEYLTHIQLQISEIGAVSNLKFDSLDTDTKLFTNECFIKLYEKGYIEKRPSMINWSYFLKAPVPETDIKYANIDGRTLIKVPGYEDEIEFGVMNDIIYKVEGTGEDLVIATAKPETLFADVAIAVHPDDKRYDHLIGKNAVHPLSGKLLPIILDDELVNMEFGTGVLRLAPSNNIKDYTIGLKYGLEFIQIYNEDGTLNEKCGPEWKGIQRLDARKLILKKLKEKGLFLGSKDNPMRVQKSLKTGDIIEKRLHSHWWIDFSRIFNDFKKEINRFVSSEMKFSASSPGLQQMLQKEISNLENTALNITTENSLYKTNSTPSYFVKLANNHKNSVVHWIVAKNDNDANTIAKEKFPNESFELVKDDDNIECWFYEAVYALTSVGFPGKSKLFETFYPHDIFVGCASDFQKLARTIAVCVALTGSAPFNELIIHPLVTDFNDRKLSKKLGNTYDPLYPILGFSREQIKENLKKYSNNNEKDLNKLIKLFEGKFAKGFDEIGSDALRLTFLTKFNSSNNYTLNSIIDINNIRKNVSKIYQTIKFSYMELAISDYKEYSGVDFLIDHVYDKWMMQKLFTHVKKCNDYLEKRDMQCLVEQTFDFWINIFSDVYFEIIKSKLLNLHETHEDRVNTKRVLFFIINIAVKLLHPICPFLSEELWQRITNSTYDSIITQSYPNPGDVEKVLRGQDNQSSFEIILNLSQFINKFIADYNIPKNNEVIIKVKEDSKEIYNNHNVITSLNRKLQLLSIIGEKSDILNAGDYISRDYSSNFTVYLLVRGQLDIEKEISNNEKKLLKLNKQKKQIETLQNGKDYASKAQQELKDRHNVQISGFTKEINSIEEINTNLEKLSFSKL